MRAIDTNVLVRFLTADDEKQARAAREVFADGNVFIATTVILECEWVLRAGYGFAPKDIAQALRAIGGISGVTFEEPAEIAQALDALSHGLDFADALHLAKSAHCIAFVTFDRKLVRRAKAISATPVVLP